MSFAARFKKTMTAARVVDVVVATNFLVGAIWSLFLLIAPDVARASKINAAPHNISIAVFVALYVAMGVGVLIRPRIAYLLVAVFEAFLLFGAVATLALAPLLPATTHRLVRLDGWFFVWTSIDVLVLVAAIWRIRSGNVRAA